MLQERPSYEQNLLEKTFVVELQEVSRGLRSGRGICVATTVAQAYPQRSGQTSPHLQVCN